ncbi:MAG: HAMP domain-containing protein, partial [Parvularculaceae bacterium]|nr:HAMP domain-containing protein [Parvularculaceae bacterium]
MTKKSIASAARKASALISAITVFVGMVALVSIGALTFALDDSRRASEIVRVHLGADMMHDAIRGDVLKALLAANGGPGATVDEAKRDLEEHIKEFEEAVAAAKALARGKELSVLEALTEPLSAYAASAKDMVSLAGKDAVAAEMAYPTFSVKFKELEESMASATDVLGAAQAESVKRSALMSVLAAVLILVTVGGAVATAHRVAFIARRRVVEPLTALARAMENLAAGDDAADAAGAERPDELGAMARAFVKFRQAGVERRRLEREAEDERRRAAERDRAIELERSA